jgi:hypothetical protein
MRYLILSAGDEKSALKMSPEEGMQIVAKYKKYTEELKSAGVHLAGDGLQPSMRGARVTVANGKRNVIDGPFSESKEIVGGYYLIQVKSKEEAIEWASRCPSAQYPGRSYAEVREVMEFPA